MLAPCRFATEQPENLAIIHVAIINPGIAETRTDMTILIRGRDIVLVGRSEDMKVPSTFKIVKGTGKFVIPALWDLHTHLRDANRDMDMYLANGVLGIRDMGGSPDEVFPIRDAIAAGQQLGPKIVASGPIVDGPNSWSNPKFTVSVSSAEEARSTVQALKKEGADFIKVYDGLSLDEDNAIAEEAKNLNLTFAGHRPGAVSVRRA